MTAEGFRLSAPQRRLWEVQRSVGGGFTAWGVLRLPGDVDPRRLRAVLDQLVARHEILRMRFVPVPGATVPLQVVADGRIELSTVDLRAVRTGERDERFRRLVADGSAVPGATLVLLAAGHDGARLLLRLPAMCADEASVRTLLDEVPPRLRGDGDDEEPLQYVDFAQWQDDLLTDDEYALEREFWTTGPAPAPGTPDPPYVLSRPAGEAFRPAHVAVPVPADLGADPGGLLLTAWHLVLRVISGAGTPVAVRLANRGPDERERALGLYEKYAPFTLHVEEDHRLTEVVRRVADRLRDMAQQQEYFGWELIGERWFGAARRPFLDAAFSWQPVAGDAGVEEAGAVTEPFRVRLSGEGDRHTVRARLWYDAAHCAERDMRQLAGLVANAVSALCARPEAVVADLGELIARPAPALPVAVDRTSVTQRFAAAARAHPGRIAVRAGHAGLTYAELDAFANRLARRLTELGVGADVVVGLSVDRSCELVVGLLGILKAGGAYVPVDPAWPDARRESVLARAGATVVVTGPDRSAGDGRVRVAVDGTALAEYDDGAVPAAPADERLAYVLFTSGSTGEPKGVAVSQAALAGYLAAVTERFGLTAADVHLSVSPITADLGNTSLFGALCTGGTLHLASTELATDAHALQRYAHRAGITVLKAVPSHLRALLAGDHPARLLPTRHLILGGEAADWELVDTVAALRPDLTVTNHYGPTETTVGVLTHTVTGAPRTAPVPPLGRPLPHSSVHVLDRRLNPVPTWAVGEIYVGGAAVARGYQHRPALTAQRFVPDPYSPVPGARLYRTGDRARRLSDGTLVFLGRTDHQTKIRGHRIEPAEIEHVLRQHPHVRQALVTGELVAYTTGAATAAELTAHARRQLPEHMVPAAFVTLDEFPLTDNGKIDRGALPQPHTGTEYTPPETPAEQALAAIWADLLHHTPVGRHDNFFALGGDSILSIQVVARANQAGLRLTPKMLFRNPTVATLAAAGERSAAATTDEKGLVSGDLPLTPIQRWFFDQRPPAPHHYNQAVLLRVRGPLDPVALDRAVTTLRTHHDALRLTYHRTDEGWRQTHREPDRQPPAVSTVDLSTTPPDEQLPALRRHAARHQRTLDLAAGPLFTAVHYDTGAGHDHHLLLTAHHLTIDGVSWRILLDDLVTAYRRHAPLPPKTTSYQRWSRHLAAHAHTPHTTGQIPYWTGLLTTTPGAVPPDHPGGANTYRTAETVTTTLDRRTTGRLTHLPPAVSTLHVVLAALGHTLTDWTGEPRILVDIEGHGRRPFTDDIDLTRTVGWFTTIHPLVLSAGDVPETLRTVRAGLDAVVDGGLGFALLRHGRTDPATDVLRAAPAPAVRFNYHGVVTSSEADTLFADASSAVPETADPAGSRPYELDVTAVVADGGFQASWTYSGAIHRAGTIRSLAEHFDKSIRAVLEHAEQGPPEDVGPGFSLSLLGQSQLDSIAEALGRADQD